MMFALRTSVALTTFIGAVFVGCSSVSSDGTRWIATEDESESESEIELGMAHLAVLSDVHQACSCTLGNPPDFVDTILTNDNWTPTNCMNYCQAIGAATSRLICTTSNLWTTGSAATIPTVPSISAPSN